MAEEYESSRQGLSIDKKFPKDEVFGLTSQIRRAAVSVPSNISEGAAGRSVTQFRNFLAVAIGSLNEISTQLEIAHRVGYLEARDCSDAEGMVDECIALTYGLRKARLKSDSAHIAFYCSLLTE